MNIPSVRKQIGIPRLSSVRICALFGAIYLVACFPEIARGALAKGDQDDWKRCTLRLTGQGAGSPSRQQVVRAHWPKPVTGPVRSGRYLYTVDPEMASARVRDMRTGREVSRRLHETGTEVGVDMVDGLAAIGANELAVFFSHGITVLDHHLMVKSRLASAMLPARVLLLRPGRVPPLKVVPDAGPRDDAAALFGAIPICSTSRHLWCKTEDGSTVVVLDKELRRTYQFAVRGGELLSIAPMGGDDISVAVRLGGSRVWRAVIACGTWRVRHSSISRVQ